MKTTKTAPAWAIELVEQVCKDYSRKTPDLLQWYATSNKHTSGYTWYSGKKIHISAGIDDIENKVVVLHELTHHIIAKSKKGKREHHSIRFWRLFWELAKTYGNLEDAYSREVQLFRQWRPDTRVKAQMAYDELHLKKVPR